MNSTIVLLILTWLPVIAESGLFAVVGVFIEKTLKEHFSIPNKLTKEIKEQKNQIAELNRQIRLLLDDNANLRTEIYKNTLEMRGIRSNESIKKN